ncbi:acyl carrier protein [Chelativorans sp. M5D2P16]|uniref:acyl carrier protein n=1 Tax=Chelativorans sp. M5D2P16 TaxID=3095678 RepID=UPI002ACA73FC|nr:acyl carrier protein [Chelativorans sp. M5D2P16]MDZ5699770.1 acyl carrier protein [Chelativorans sp. M5D2P16]
MTETTRMMEQIRGELSRVLDKEPGDLAADTNLMEVGLHSLAIMRLVSPLSQIAGTRLDYADLAREPSLGTWQALLCRLQKGA